MDFHNHFAAVHRCAAAIYRLPHQDEESDVYFWIMENAIHFFGVDLILTFDEFANAIRYHIIGPKDKKTVKESPDKTMDQNERRDVSSSTDL